MEEVKEKTTPAEKFFWLYFKNNRKEISLGVLLLFILLFFILIFFSRIHKKSTSIPAQPIPTPAQTSEKVPGQILVKFKRAVPEAVIAEHLQVYNASVSGTIKDIGVSIVQVPKGQEDAILTALSHDAIVQYVEADYYSHAFAFPNDPYFSNQWGLHNTAQAIQGKTGASNDDIHAVDAWNVTQGDGIKVAILDTGINQNHPDLASKIVLQKIFYTNSLEDNFGHGTHVAGIISAVTNNSQGVAGVCPNCQLMIGRVLDDNGSGPTSNIATGVTWAADNGAKVINISAGDTVFVQALADAITYAWNKGVVITAAAGNSNTTQKFYPAAYPNVIAVAATDNNDTKASFSNYGSWVLVAAPGSNIFSTLPDHTYNMQKMSTLNLNYDYLSGTSMASPFVAGAAALVWASPYGTSNTAVVQRLENTADKITGTGTYWKYGRINVANAVGFSVTTPTVQPLTPPTSTPTQQPKQTIAPTIPHVTPTPTLPFATPTFYCAGGVNCLPSTIPSPTVPVIQNTPRPTQVFQNGTPTSVITFGVPTNVPGILGGRNHGGNNNNFQRLRNFLMQLVKLLLKMLFPFF